MRQVGRAQTDDLASQGLQVGVMTGGTVTVLNATTVRVAAGSAWIATPTGLYRRVSWPQTDITVPTPAAGLRRLDQVAVDYTGAVSRLAGTAEGAGYTLDARTNAAALPATSIRLVDALADQVAGGVIAANLRDRRLWARGINSRVIRTAGGIALGAVYPGAPHDVAMQQRAECSGTLVKVRVQAVTLGTSADYIYEALFMDNAIVAGCQEQGHQGNPPQLLNHSTTFSVVPAAGSHLFDVRYHHTGGASTLNADATEAWIIGIEEDLRPNANNGST